MVLPYHSTYNNTFSGAGCSGQTQQKDMITYLLKPDVTGAYHFTTTGKSLAGVLGRCDDDVLLHLHLHARE